MDKLESWNILVSLVNATRKSLGTRDRTYIGTLVLKVLNFSQLHMFDTFVQFNLSISWSLALLEFVCLIGIPMGPIAQHVLGMIGL